jgi:hypothetical protein
MSITCDLSRKVIDMLHADELDIAIALLAQDKNPYLVRSWEERPIWAVAREAAVQRQEAGAPRHPSRRLRIPAAHDGSPPGGRPRLAHRLYDARNRRPAARGGAGLGVSALTRKTLLPDMRALSARDGFPALEPISIGLFYKHQRLSGRRADAGGFAHFPHG